jgi:tRNA (guanine-N7-)-methyltransferase
MRLYSAILTDGGTVHLKTDSNFLYTYTIALIAANSYPVQISTSDLYASGLADDILSIRTAYEQQWIDRGISIKYLRFSCVSGDVIVEPNVEIEHDPYRSYNRTKRVSNF